MSMRFRALVAQDLVRVYGDRRVLDGVSLTAAPGQRIGVVGENGVGKSTLLRLLAGVEQPDDGTVSRPDDTGFLRQELPFTGSDTVGTVLDDALAEIRAVKARLTGLGELIAAHPDDQDALAEYGELLEWAQVHDAWDADRRAELVLAGLGVDGFGRDRRLAELSGGQRSRLGLAALLIRRPSAVLLDEPTNHLDDDAIGYLERHLRGLPGVVVLTSHDRVFLDEVCTAVVDLDPSIEGVTRYRGAYSDFLSAKRAQRARWEQRRAAEQEELAELRHAVAVTSRNVVHGRPMRDNDKAQFNFHGKRVEKQVSRRVRNARARLAELTERQVRKPPPPLRFSGLLMSTVDGDGPVLSVREVVVPKRLRLDRLDVEPTARLLVTGGNGAGKSTLLAVLAGTITPEHGTVARGRGSRIGMLAQDVTFPDPARTAAAVFAERCPGISLVELGLLAGRDVGRPVGALSVGQRRRLALALLVARAPQVLLLDEPTNHISLTLAEELEDALHTAPGAVVVASHDRWLRRRWTGAELALRDGTAVT